MPVSDMLMSEKLSSEIPVRGALVPAAVRTGRPVGLTLTVVRCPSTVRPERRAVKESELSVGRGPNVDWVLPDPDQVVSRHHFTIIQRSGGWFIIDESSNGTYANRDRKPIGRGNRRRLSNRDRINVGPYELEVTVEDETFASLPRDPSLRARRPPLRDDRYGSIRDVMLPPMPGGALPADSVPLLTKPMRCRRRFACSDQSGGHPAGAGRPHADRSRTAGWRRGSGRTDGRDSAWRLPGGAGPARGPAAGSAHDVPPPG